jgi:CubicO group peptidase (beta-lactamase class C family)
MVVRGGEVVFAWGDTRVAHHVQSATKAIGGTALGLAIADGKMRLEDAAVHHHPGLGVPPEANRATAWVDRITVAQLGQMTAGFGKDGGYTELLFCPGTQWAYSDCGANWLGECVTLAYREDLAGLLWDRIFRPLGIREEELAWRDHIYRPDRIDGLKRREIGAGIFAGADSLARLGLLYLRRGRWGGTDLLPPTFVDAVATTPRESRGVGVVNDPLERFGGASAHYGLLWWNNSDASIPEMPRDAYWAWGLGDAIILVIPSLDIVVSRVGPRFPGERRPSYYRALAPFMAAIAASANG